MSIFVPSFFLYDIILSFDRWNCENSAELCNVWLCLTFSSLCFFYIFCLLKSIWNSFRPVQYRTLLYTDQMVFCIENLSLKKKTLKKNPLNFEVTHQKCGPINFGLKNVVWKKENRKWDIKKKKRKIKSTNNMYNIRDV